MKDLKQIIRGCLKNKRADQNALYSHFSAKMYGLCLRYAQGYDEAQDILQEGFIKVFANLKKFRNEGELEGWIRRIMINTAIEKYRARLRELSIFSDEQNDYGLDSNMGLDNLNLGDLLDQIQSLPMQYRLIFNLYIIEGYSHKDIAEQLNITESTSRSNLARARSILQKALNEEQKVVQKVV